MATLDSARRPWRAASVAAVLAALAMTSTTQAQTYGYGSGGGNKGSATPPPGNTWSGGNGGSNSGGAGSNPFGWMNGVLSPEQELTVLMTSLTMTEEIVNSGLVQISDSWDLLFLFLMVYTEEYTSAVMGVLGGGTGVTPPGGTLPGGTPPGGGMGSGSTPPISPAITPPGKP
jgi:hypothetical protein